MVAACPRLEAVDLSHRVAAGDREMAALAAAAGLRELVMDKCLGVTDVGLAKVAVGCPGLEKLSVKWCREISDIGIELLAKKCPELRSVDISYLKVSNESLRSLSTLEKLVDITMVCCLLVDDHGLLMLSAGNSLKSIDVSRCPHVTSEGLASLIVSQRFIQKINAGHSLHVPWGKNVILVGGKSDPPYDKISVWTFNTETELWSHMETKGDIPVKI
uniref:F-box/LRR-repeat protein 15-like leucin rich repeat domain-containing protein n=1 Tax=Setaria viridis TaxID=4556 RepID=A0A4U6SZ42_SETVI|nr:hypothetical protein SEVIR_9G289800v2 [Setaria viridis]